MPKINKFIMPLMRCSVNKLFLTTLVLLFVSASVLAQSSPEGVLPPAFSLVSGFYSEEQELFIQHPEADITIWFTVNGADPIRGDSLSTAAIEYTPGTALNLGPNPEKQHRLAEIRTNPIESDPRGYGWREPVGYGPTAHVIRAVAQYPDGSFSDVVTSTWFIGIEIPQIPVFSIVTDSLDFFGAEEGIYVPGRIYDEEGFNPNSFWGLPNANYHQRGEEWERPIYLEYFANGQSVLAQNAGARIHGSGSRSLAMKSLRLYARSDYGNSTFDFPFFGDRNDNSFKRLILRNSGQDFYNSPTMIKDGFIQELFRDLHVETQDYQPSLVYINGEFWGIHNIRKRYDHHYFSRNFGVERDEVDFLEGDGIIKEGSNNVYYTMLDSIGAGRLLLPDGYTWFKEMVDIDNFIDYFAGNIYIRNTDWPGNNIEYWRFTGDYDPGNPYTDGRWRWIVFDTDAGFSNADHNTIVFATEAGNDSWPNPDWSTFLLRHALENDSLASRFITRLGVLLNSEFSSDRVISVIDSFASRIEDYMPLHVERWQYPQTIGDWNWAIGINRNFAEARAGHVWSHLAEFFDLPNPVSFRLSASESIRSNIRIGGVEAKKFQMIDDEIHGLFFPNHFPEIVLDYNAGDEPIRWLVNDTLIVEGNLIRLQAGNDISIELLYEKKESEEQELLYFWYFNSDIPNNTPLFELSSNINRADTAQLVFTPAISYDGSGDVTGMMDRVNDPTEVNLPEIFLSDVSGVLDDMRGIRVRNPSHAVIEGKPTESALKFHMPTTGYKEIQFSFAARRTNNGQEFLFVEYANEAGGDWYPFFEDQRLLVVNPDSFTRHAFDFPNEWAADKPDFRVRLTFRGDNTTSGSGNVRFNNVVLKGRETTVSTPTPEPPAELPKLLTLYPNYPNPFNPITTIRFSITESVHTSIQVYNMIGERVAQLANEIFPAGEHHVRFNAAGLASGVYLYTISAGDVRATGKMLLIR